MNMFEIRKHGGHKNHTWRTILSTRSMDKALDKYISTGHSLKQGVIELLQDGDVLYRHQTPRARRSKRQRGGYLNDTRRI